MENDDNKTTKNVSLKQPKDKAQTNGKCPLFLGDTATGTVNLLNYSENLINP